jgi:hypothetical protein
MVDGFEEATENDEGPDGAPEEGDENNRHQRVETSLIIKSVGRVFADSPGVVDEGDNEEERRDEGGEEGEGVQYQAGSRESDPRV